MGMVMVSVIYTGLLIPGLLLVVERPKETASVTATLAERLREAGNYITSSVLTSPSFYLLFLIRLLLMVIMAAISFPLALIVAGINFVSSFTVLLALVWSTFLLSFAHFSTIPAHALALFQSPHSGVVVSAIGFSDTMAYAVLSLLNATVMSDESDANRFTWL